MMWRTGCLLLVLLGACAGDRKVYAGLDFSVGSTPPIPAKLTRDLIQLAEGTAIQATAFPSSKGKRDYTDEDRVTLRSRDDRVLGVRATDAPRDFVFVGIAEGATCVEVEINGRSVDCIEAQVIAQ